jgi:hypothetical protein
MTRATRIALGILLLWIAVALYWLQGVQQATQVVRREPSEELLRREVTQPPIATPTDTTVKARLYWASRSGEWLEPVETELPLSADPALRAKQLLDALIARSPDDRPRVLPADATLLELYLLPGGVAVADFSGALANSLPSGILSERLAVDSITRTLAENVPQILRLKIVVQGQEMETLAGHMDLTGFFELRAPADAKPQEKSAARLEEPAPPQP